MRTPLVIPLSLSVLPGCVDSVDPSEAFLDLAEALTTDVYDAVWDAVEEEEDIELWPPASQQTIQGSLDIPTTSGASHGVDGELQVQWELSSWESETLEDEYHWDWSFTLTIDRLALPSCEVAGQGAWIVEETWYDFGGHSHDFQGELALDEGEPQPLALEAYYSGNLHSAAGSIGDLEVDWENDNPDLP